MPVRMKDIAQDLELSIVTVSKVLRNHPDISAETRDRVLKRMKEVNYRPNLAARALVTGKTFSMWVWWSRIWCIPSSREVAKGMSRLLAQAGLQPDHFVVRRRAGTRAARGGTTACAPR